MPLLPQRDRSFSPDPHPGTDRPGVSLFLHPTAASLHGLRAGRSGSLLGCCRGQLKIGQRGGMAEEWVTSPAFGNKRKRILFAHTEENSSSFPHETRRPRPGLPEDTLATHPPSPVPFSLYQPPVVVARPRSSVGCRVQNPVGSGAGIGVLAGMRNTEEAKEGQQENLRV